MTQISIISIDACPTHDRHMHILVRSIPVLTYLKANVLNHYTFYECNSRPINVLFLLISPCKLSREQSPCFTMRGFYNILVKCCRPIRHCRSNISKRNLKCRCSVWGSSFSEVVKMHVSRCVVDWLFWQGRPLGTTNEPSILTYTYSFPYTLD